MCQRCCTGTCCTRPWDKNINSILLTLHHVIVIAIAVVLDYYLWIQESPDFLVPPSHVAEARQNLKWSNQPFANGKKVLGPFKLLLSHIYVGAYQHPGRYCYTKVMTCTLYRSHPINFKDNNSKYNCKCLINVIIKPKILSRSMFTFWCRLRHFWCTGNYYSRPHGCNSLPLCAELPWKVALIWDLISTKEIWPSHQWEREMFEEKFHKRRKNIPHGCNSHVTLLVHNTPESILWRVLCFRFGYLGIHK